MGFNIEEETKKLKEACETISDNIEDWMQDKDYKMADKAVAELFDSVVFVRLFLIRQRDK